MVLQPGKGQEWTSASVEGESLQPAETGGWRATPVRPGTWNSVSTEGGSVEGARLVAVGSLHISSLEATVAPDRSLSARVRLSEGAQGPVTITLTVTAPDGRQVGGTDVVLSRKTRELSVALPLSNARAGDYRVKATLSDGEHLVDNARTEVKIP